MTKTIGELVHLIQQNKSTPIGDPLIGYPYPTAVIINQSAMFTFVEYSGRTIVITEFQKLQGTITRTKFSTNGVKALSDFIRRLNVQNDLESRFEQKILRGVE
jgi:hypothetical protein